MEEGEHTEGEGIHGKVHTRGQLIFGGLLTFACIWSQASSHVLWYMEGRTLSCVGINQNCSTRIHARTAVEGKNWPIVSLPLKSEPLLQDDAKVDPCKRRPCCKLTNTCACGMA